MLVNATRKSHEVRLTEGAGHLDNYHAINISQANWMNLVPDLYNKDVLKVGTERIDNIMAIVYFEPKTLSCIGYPNVKIEKVSTVVVK